MLTNEIRRKLESIIQGNVIEESEDTCATIRNFLCKRFATDTTVKKDFESKQLIKKEQGQLLKNFVIDKGLFLLSLRNNGFI
jgi:translation initiation factor 1 (eIF-1/SUI1)